jgi:hypothetical protein
MDPPPAIIVVTDFSDDEFLRLVVSLSVGLLLPFPPPTTTLPFAMGASTVADAEGLFVEGGVRGPLATALFFGLAAFSTPSSSSLFETMETGITWTTIISCCFFVVFGVVVIVPFVVVCCFWDSVGVEVVVGTAVGPPPFDCCCEMTRSPFDVGVAGAGEPSSAGGVFEDPLTVRFFFTYIHWQISGRK